MYLDRNQQNKQNRKSRIKIYFSILILLLMFLLVFYIFIYSPIFQIREFHITGSKKISNSDVIKILLPLVLESKTENFFGYKNLLSWDESKINFSKTAILEAQIKRDWLRQSIDIDIKERERLAIWCDSFNNCYWIDENGILFEESPNTEGSLY